MNDVALMRQLDATRPINPVKFAHFVLRTGQFDSMIEWYQTVLAARVVFRDDMLCFLSYDDEHHRLALINIPGLPVRSPDAVGTDHVAYAYNSLGELLSTYRRLKGAGIPPHWPINQGVTTSMCYPTRTTTGSSCRSTITRRPPSSTAISRAASSPRTRSG